jgi:HEAT repeat protein
MKQTDRLALALGLSVLAASFPLAAQQKLTVVSLPLAQELVKIFPDIGSGYIDFSGNGKPDQTSDLNEYIPESRVRDGQLQAQEILDFIVDNWRFIGAEKLKAVKAAVGKSAGAIGELIAIDYAASLDDAIAQRELMGDGLYLTPSAYKEAMARIGGIVSSMATTYKKEGAKADAEFTAARDSLFDLIEKGYPLPLDLPDEERNVLSTSMTSVILKEQKSNPARTKTAIRVLGLLKSAEAAPYLLDLASGSSYAVEAMKALADIGYRPAISTIAGQLKSASAAETKKTALYAIGAIGGSEALDAILDIVKPANRDSLPPELLEASTQALAGIAGKGNTDSRIFNALKDLSGNGRPGIRRIAASGLGSFTTALSAETLLAMVNAEKDLGVRKAAIISLNRQAPDQSIAALMRVLREKELDPGVRATALGAVGSNAQGAQGISLLVENLGNQDASVRAAASGSLKKLAPANQAAVSASLSRSLATSADEAFLVEGASLLANLADPSSIPTILTLMGRPIPELKRIAAWAFYRLRSSSNPKVPEELQKLVTNENEGMGVRINAARALGAIGYDSAALNVWQTLVTTMQMRGEKYSMLRFYALRSLGQLLPMKPQAAAALLRAAAKDPDMEMRKEAVNALRNYGGLDDAAAETLAGSFIEAGDAELKARIIEALSDSGSAKAVSLAQDFLSADPPLSLKKRVIAALAQSPSEESAAVILDAAKDPAAGDYVVGALEGFPRALMSSIVPRRQRTETDKNVLSVLASLESIMTD